MANITEYIKAEVWEILLFSIVLGTMEYTDLKINAQFFVVAIPIFQGWLIFTAQIYTVYHLAFSSIRKWEILLFSIVLEQ